MIDLSDIAARLDAEEKFNLKYRFPVRSSKGSVEYETRVGKLLDVAEEAGLIYVSHDGNVIWVKTDEVIDIEPVQK